MKTEGYYLCVFVPFFCRVSFSIPMRVEEGKALIQDFFSLVRWVSFSIPTRAEGRSFVVIGVPSCMPGIVFDTYACVRALLLVVRVSFSIPTSEKGVRH